MRSYSLFSVSVEVPYAYILSDGQLGETLLVSKRSLIVCELMRK